MNAELAPADDELRGQVEHCSASVGPKVHGCHSIHIIENCAPLNTCWAQGGSADDIFSSTATSEAVFDKITK